MVKSRGNSGKLTGWGVVIDKKKHPPESVAADFLPPPLGPAPAGSQAELLQRRCRPATRGAVSAVAALRSGAVRRRRCGGCDGERGFEEQVGRRSEDSVVILHCFGVEDVNGGVRRLDELVDLLDVERICVEAHSSSDGRRRRKGLALFGNASWDVTLLTGFRFFPNRSCLICKLGHLPAVVFFAPPLKLYREQCAFLFHFLSLAKKNVELL